MGEQLTLELLAPAPERRPSDERCRRCGAQLAASDRHYHRRQCGPCRAMVDLERLAERDWKTAPVPRPCRCERPFILEDPDERRCLQCGRRPR